MAEDANASSGSSFGLDRPQYQQQTALHRLKQNLPRTNQGLLSRPFSSSIPSLSDINTLESTLSSLEAQLRTLKSQKPEVKPERLSQIESKIATLKATISDSKEAYSTYLQASETLKKALKAQTVAQAAYELAVVAEATAGSTLTAKQDSLAALEIIKASKTTSLANLQELFNNTKIAADSADASLTEQKKIKANAEAALAIRQEQYITASAKLASAQQTFNEASSEVQLAARQLNSSNQTLNEKQQTLSQAQSNYNNNLIPDPTWIAPTYQKENIRLVENTRTVEVVTPTPRTEIVEHVTQVPVYTQVPTTTLVPTTTTQVVGGVLAEVFNRNGYNNAPPLPYQNETPIYSTIVPNINFEWGGGQILESGRSEDVIVRFTGNLLFPEDGYYRFYTPADDGTMLNIAGMSLINDWYDKGGGGTVSQEVFIRGGVLYPFTLHYYENGGGAAVWMYYYTPDTGYLLVPAAYMGTQTIETTTYEEVTTWETVTTYEEVVTYEEVTTWEDVITYEEETYYTEEIYYTTELVKTEGTIQVKINEGGQATFTAPQGAVFTGSTLRYEAIDRPECGADIQPNVNGLSQVTIQADNGVWGDPCGGWYKHVTGTLTYLGQPTAPLIRDSALLPILEAAQLDYDDALADTQAAQAEYDAAVLTNSASNDEVIAAQEDLDNSSTNKLAAEAELATQTTELNRLATSNETAQAELTTATQNLSTANEELTTATNNVTTASSEVVSAELEVSRTTNEKAAAATSLEDSSSEVTAAQETETKTASAASTLTLEATTKATQTEQDIFTASTDTVPEPEPVPEEGSKEIPAELSAENLMEVNLEAVDPTELTEAQAEQLVEAALETFETAEAGSAEYEQALDALYLAAEQDDIELPEELAAIPGLAGAVEVLNFLGNAGADMSPKVREQSEKVVVTAVVAAGVAVQAAAGAATSAAVSSSAPSGGSSGGSRRVGK
jgi:hypothetical protein